MLPHTLANVDLWLLLAKIFNPVTFNHVTKNTVTGLNLCYGVEGWTVLKPASPYSLNVIKRNVIL